MRGAVPNSAGELGWYWLLGADVAGMLVAAVGWTAGDGSLSSKSKARSSSMTPVCW